MADDWSAALDPGAIGAVLTDTAFGHAWAAHLVLAAALVAVVVFGPRGRWAPTALASAALLASLGLVGHAAMQTGAEGVLHRANHAVHLLTAGAWIGGLVPFAMCLRAYERDDLRRGRGPGDDRLFLLGTIHRRGDRSHRRRQHRADLRPPADPADHALPRASGRENRSRRDHDLACASSIAMFSRRKLKPGATRALAVLRATSAAEVALGSVVVALVSVFALLDPA